jgi:ATP-dependent Clp protease ATP-binding subunit ClpC
LELILILIFVVAFLVGFLGRRHRRDKPAAGDDTPAAQELTPATSSSTETDQASLVAQLHRFEGSFAPFAASSAHPRELSDHAEFRAAVARLADPAVSLETVMQYVEGANWMLACAALAALAERKDGVQALDPVVAHFDRLAPWPMHFAFEYFLRVEPRPAVGAPAVGAKDWWRDNPMMPVLFRDYFGRRADFGDSADFGTALESPSASPPATIRAFLERVNHPMAAALVARLDQVQRHSIDRAFLTSFGRFWSDLPDSDILIEPDDWRDLFVAAEAMLQQTPLRSMLVSGEALVGKTSFLRLLAQRLARKGWSVFEASGADLMAGQLWFGQLEGRIRQVVDELAAGKKLIWYIPDLLQLARSGTHQGQSASILDQVLPAIVAGRLVVWTEASTTATARLLQIHPVLRRNLEVIRLEPQMEEDTRSLARTLVARLSDQRRLTIHACCADVAVDSARQYLSSSSFPGAALQLIKLTVRRTDARPSEIAPTEVLQTLSQLTGLPISILDSNEHLDLATVRNFLASRVIGQDEATASIVDRIAMLKAGLSDPARPIGVFLFAGPTGTGKTELAKATAEYLFGSADRLIRLDMSEFQTPESMASILGSGVHGEAETLISGIRKQPFSVVLLDEFEKAHPRIWDLFLQVFDAGRLTDSLGQVADFRHCFIILTTNLGATTHQSSGFGFASSSDVFTTDQVMRAIAQTYRPELQNRLDKIIVFRPLTRDLMRIILRKELNCVLERRGLKDRTWAVEWEASALEFLLEKGFSPEMGARPLKRAIEQYVIAPLAATIVERRFPEGDQFVFFRSDGRCIQAEFVDPDIDAAPAPAPDAPISPPALGSMILAPRGSDAEIEALAAATAEIERSIASPEWDALKRHLSKQMSNPEFWKSPDRHLGLARLALMDRVTAAAGTIAALRARLARAVHRPGYYSRELVSRLALQVSLVKEGVRDVFEGAPIEVALAVEPALDPAGEDSPATAAWCRQLLDMYRGWSCNRHMQISELDGSGRNEPPILLISGFGAHRVLARECGLHVLELPDGSKGSSRATARVVLVVTPLGDVPSAKMESAVIRQLDTAPRLSTLVRRYRGEPAPLVRNADGSWRTGRFDAVLRGDFDLLAAEEAPLATSIDSKQS